MHETGRSGPVHWDDPGGGVGREVGGASGWGTHVHQWLIHVNVWQKPSQYCKVISLQLKFFFNLKKKKSVPGAWLSCLQNDFTSVSLPR